LEATDSRQASYDPLVRRVAFAVGLAALAGCGKERVSTEATPRERVVSGASGSTKGAGKDLSTPASGETFAIRMTRAACYGTCPVYDLEIDADGSVRFEGARYVRVRGKQSANVAAADVAALVARFEATHFFELTWDDPCKNVATDHATVTLTLVDKGRKRTVVDYLGNGCVPASLRALPAEVDRVARTDAWTKCEKRPNPPFPDADWCER
jgi:hypothetical protein